MACCLTAPSYNMSQWWLIISEVLRQSSEGNSQEILKISILNTLRPSRNEQHFADDIFKPVFFNENVWVSIKISLKFVPKGSINNIPALVQIMAWCRSGDKPLSEPIMVSLPTHIYVTRPQWVNMCLKIANLRLQSHLPGANELIPNTCLEIAI